MNGRKRERGGMGGFFLDWGGLERWSSEFGGMAHAPKGGFFEPSRILHQHFFGPLKEKKKKKFSGK